MPHHVTSLRPLLFVPLLTSCVPTGTPVTDDAGAIEGRLPLDAGHDAARAPQDRDAAVPVDAGVVDAADSPPDLCAMRECSGATPYCDPIIGRCEICLEDAHCTEPGTRCLAHTCVECVSDVDCEGTPRPYCASSVCVECKVDDDCPATTPYCVSNACVECRAGVQSDCSASVMESLCVEGTCGQCGSNADCPARASRCDASSLRCTHCEENADCAGQRAAGGLPLPVCDVGTCVECTGTQAEACSSGDEQFVCDSVKRSCTVKPPGTVGTCSSCLSDAHCIPGMLCMHTKKGTADAGLFCLPKEADQANAMCPTTGDFTIPEATWTSVDGVNMVVCRHATLTCTEWINSVWD